MPYAIYRCAKIKSVGALAASASHNARSRATPNADPVRTLLNCQLHGFEGRIPQPADMLAEWQRRVEGVKRKPDAVLAQEIFLGVSPEFYDGAEGATKNARREAWQARAMRWLEDLFGENLMSATLHLDESTPHVCAFVVPVTEAKDGSRWLSAKKLFNPASLVQQQDSYAAILADLGLERGVRGSTAKHQEVTKFYGQLAQAEPGLVELDQALTEQVKIFLPDKGLFESGESYQQKVAAIVATGTTPVAAAARKVEEVAKEVVTVRSQNKSLRATNGCLARSLAKSRNELIQYTDQLRDIPLDTVMARLGFPEPHREGSGLVWRTGQHVIAVNGVKWFDHRAGCGGGKAIDLTMHVMGCDFRQAVGWLAGQWAENEVTAAVRSAAETFVAGTPRKDFGDLWEHYAQPNPDATRTMRRYLTEERRLDSKLVDSLIAGGLIHGSHQLWRSGGRRVWSVFRHCDTEGITRGATLRAADHGDGGKRTLGDKTNSFFSFGQSLVQAHHVALVESPIDAISYFQRNPETRVISMAGSSIPVELLPSLVTCRRIAVALDRDEAGDAGSRRFMTYLERHAPLLAGRAERLSPIDIPPRGTAKDWNEILVRTAVRDNDQRKGMAQLRDPRLEIDR